MNRLILFAHFDAENRVKPYILYHLQALKALGGRIHFISNSPLPSEEVEKVAPYVERTLLHENRGLDFGMWKDALEDLDFSSFDELVLTNSSVVGPIHPLAPIFQRMDGTPCDFWGMTESREILPHLQSFFLVFRKQVFSSSSFREFFSSVLPYRSRLNVVLAYELGLTTYLQENGFQGGAAFPNGNRRSPFLQNLVFRKSAVNRIRPKKNPTLFYPDLMILEGMPYFKIMLFRENPYGIRMDSLRRLIQSTGFDLNLMN